MSTHTNTQVHSKFKIFVGELAADKTLGKLGDEVAAFASGKAAKSIGVEYLESAKKLVISLGYRDDEPGYPVELKAVALGKSGLGTEDLGQLEEAISKASHDLGNVICHELYVTEEHEFIMVFLLHK
jgi:hypothetical protein